MTMTVKEAAAWFAKLAETYPDAEVVTFDGEHCSFDSIDPARDLPVMRGFATRSHATGAVWLCPFEHQAEREGRRARAYDKVVVAINCDADGTPP